MGVKFLCANCGAEWPEDATICANCGAESQTIIAEAVPEADTTGGLIPYRNPAALVAYYLGVFSAVPFVGLPLGLAAVILGVRGLRARKKNPAVRGGIHAGIGIGCGCLFALLWGGLLALGVVSVLTGM